MAASFIYLLIEYHLSNLKKEKTTRGIANKLVNWSEFRAKIFNFSREKNPMTDIK